MARRLTWTFLTSFQAATGRARRGAGLWSFFIALGLSGCGGNRSKPASVAPTPQCITGQQLRCNCTAERVGAQVCDAGGVLGPCICQQPPVSTATTTPTVQAGAGVDPRLSRVTTAPQRHLPTATSAGFAPGSPAVCLSGGNIIAIVGDKDDFLSGGADELVKGEFQKSLLWDGHKIQVVAAPDNSDTREHITLDFSSSKTSPKLKTGRYEKAERFADERGARAGLDVLHGSRACEDSSGSFTVHELVLRDEEVVKFTATFEQHCERKAKKLQGCVHVENTSLERAPTYGSLPARSSERAGTSDSYQRHDPKPCLSGGNVLVLSGQSQSTEERISQRYVNPIITPAVSLGGEAVNLTVTAPDGKPWQLEFESGEATKPLREADYIRTQHTTNGQFAFRLGTEGAPSCRAFTSHFRVHAFEHEGQVLRRFVATFEQQCHQEAPPIMGCVSYFATGP